MVTRVLLLGSREKCAGIYINDVTMTVCMFTVCDLYDMSIIVGYMYISMQPYACDTYPTTGVYLQSYSWSDTHTDLPPP